jgi:hypothetical protein
LLIKGDWAHNPGMALDLQSLMNQLNDGVTRSDLSKMSRDELEAWGLKNYELNRAIAKLVSEIGGADLLGDEILPRHGGKAKPPFA